MKVSIAIVSYHSDLSLLKRALQSVVTAAAKARAQRPALWVDFYLLDNDPAGSGSRGLQPDLQRMEAEYGIGVHVIRNGVNLGYGAGHNRCLPQLDSEVHLILNPDVVLAPDYLVEGLAYLEREPEVVMVAPHVRHEDGSPAHLCKRYPTVADLLLRGFMPMSVQRWFEPRLARYRMQDLYDNGTPCKDVPIISGCCMLVRTSAFRQLGGFDERFFLYFEDFDLSIRAAALGQVAYNPSMQITHGGGFSSRKGWWHIRQFTWSGRKFFKKHGWKWC